MDELRFARTAPQATVADLKCANRRLEIANNEEGQSANEELRALNEQLQTANAELESSKARLQERTDEIGRVRNQLRVLLDATADAVVATDTSGRIVTFNKSAVRMFGYAAEEVIGRRIDILLPVEPGNSGASLRAFIGTPREVMASRRTGARFPALLSVSKTSDAELLVCCLSDLTVNKALQQEVLRIATLEQQRIGQELHDGLQQELTGLGLLAQNLADELAQRGSADPALASRLAAGVAQANLNVRALARGLVPVPIDAERLPIALAELAKSTQETYKVECRLECFEPIEAPSAAAATHLYRIAQEAVGNAVRHAKSKDIRVRLMREDDGLRLEVADDGTGIPALPAGRAGLGLRLMEHRCALIGGRFAIEPRAGGGTVVSCTVAARIAS